MNLKNASCHITSFLGKGNKKTPHKKYFFCYDKHTMTHSTLCKYENPGKEREWVLDYSKWTETLCIYLYRMLGNDMDNKLIQGWGKGK